MLPNRKTCVTVHVRGRLSTTKEIRKTQTNFTQRFGNGKKNHSEKRKNIAFFGYVHVHLFSTCSIACVPGRTLNSTEHPEFRNPTLMVGRLLFFEGSFLQINMLRLGFWFKFSKCLGFRAERAVSMPRYSVAWTATKRQLHTCLHLLYKLMI